MPGEDSKHRTARTEPANEARVVDRTATVSDVPDVRINKFRNWNSMKYVGTITSKPVNRDNDWRFSIWNDKAGEGRECISSVRYRVENQGQPFPADVGDIVGVFVDHETHGVVWFEHLEILKKQPRG